MILANCCNCTIYKNDFLPSSSSSYAAYIRYMCNGPFVIVCNSLFITAGLTNFLFDVLQDVGILPLISMKKPNCLKSNKNV